MDSLTPPLVTRRERFEDMSLEMFRRFKRPVQMSFAVSSNVRVDLSEVDKTTIAKNEVCN